MTPTIERALAAWPVLAAQSIVFGTAAFALTLSRRPECDPRRFEESLELLWRGLALVALGFTPLVLLVDTAAMAGIPVTRAAPFMREVVRETHFGHVWLWRFGSVLALVAAAWMPLRETARTILMCAIAGILLLLTSLASHAVDHGARAIVIYFIHEIAASLWIGAVLGLWIGAARGRLGADWITHMCLRVSSVAAWAVLALVASGVYTAYVALDGDPSRLVYSAYGRVLTIKVATAAVVLLIGGYNRVFVIPAIAKSSSRKALLRNVGVESAILIGVFGLAALLANTPPAH
jgi:putative copper resistance protein D